MAVMKLKAQIERERAAHQGELANLPADFDELCQDMRAYMSLQTAAANERISSLEEQLNSQTENRKSNAQA